DFFDLEVETVLYIDVDAIVVDSISDLFNQELEEYVIAAVDIPFAECEEHCPLPPEFNYFNSGVLLFNLKRWRDEKYRSQIVNYILDNSKSIEYPDQDALNGVLFNKRL
ncbi:glycosyltransferase family 8 protein, partial [Photobacterium sanctipauli]